MEKAFVRFKALADQKKEIFDEDLDAIVADEIIRVPEKFKLLQMNVSSGSFAAPTATVEMEIDGKVKKAAAHGRRPGRCHLQGDQEADQEHRPACCNLPSARLPEGPTPRASAPFASRRTDGRCSGRGRIPTSSSPAPRPTSMP